MELNDIINGGVPKVINKSLVGKRILYAVKSFIKEHLVNIDECNITECRIIEIVDNEYVKFCSCAMFSVEENESSGKTVIAEYDLWWHNLNDIIIVAVLKD